MTLLFVMAFEFGPGPIVWLYMSEVMNDKGVSMGTLLNWTLTLIVGSVTPTLFNAIGSGGTFIMFGVFSGIATIFVLLFMKETKGLTEEQVKKLYLKGSLDNAGEVREFEEKLAYGIPEDD